MNLFYVAPWRLSVLKHTRSDSGFSNKKWKRGEAQTQKPAWKAGLARRFIKI
jgi:hypothetical protein